MADLLVNGLLSLPSELIIEVLGRLMDARSLLAVGQVSKGLRSVVEAHDLLWKPIALRETAFVLTNALVKQITERQTTWLRSLQEHYSLALVDLSISARQPFGGDHNLSSFDLVYSNPLDRESDFEVVMSSDSGNMFKTSFPSFADERVYTSHTSYLRSIKTLPGTRLVATGSNDTEIHITDVDSGEVVAKLLGHEGRVCALDCIEKHTLYSGSADGRVGKWNLEFTKEGKVTWTVESMFNGDRSSTAAISVIKHDDGREMIVSGSLRGRLVVWSDSGAVLSDRACGARIYTVATSKRHFVCGMSTLVNVFDWSYNRVAELDTGADVWMVAFASERALLVSCSDVLLLQPVRNLGRELARLSWRSDGWWAQRIQDSFLVCSAEGELSLVKMQRKKW